MAPASPRCENAPENVCARRRTPSSANHTCCPEASSIPEPARSSFVVPARNQPSSVPRCTNIVARSTAELPFTYVNAARGCRRRGGRENVRSSTREAEKPFHAASSPTATAAESYQASGAATSSSPGHGANAGRSPSR